MSRFASTATIFPRNESPSVLHWVWLTSSHQRGVEGPGRCPAVPGPWRVLRRQSSEPNPSATRSKLQHPLFQNPLSRWDFPQGEAVLSVRSPVSGLR